MEERINPASALCTTYMWYSMWIDTQQTAGQDSRIDDMNSSDARAILAQTPCDFKSGANPWLPVVLLPGTDPTAVLLSSVIKLRTPSGAPFLLRNPRYLPWSECWGVLFWFARRVWQSRNIFTYDFNGAALLPTLRRTTKFYCLDAPHVPLGVSAVGD